MSISTKNPQSKPINQGRGPVSGNGDNGAKRKTFIKEKADSGNERTQLADFVMAALEARGRGTEPAIEAFAEPLDANRGPRANPTAGGTKYNVKSKTPGKITK